MLRLRNFLRFLHFTTQNQITVMACQNKVKKPNSNPQRISDQIGVDRIQCYLLSIPQELRDMIYKYSIAAESPVVIWGSSMQRKSMRGFGAEVHGKDLLRTCKQIYSETRRLLYRQIEFGLRFDYNHANLGETINFNIMRNVVDSPIAVRRIVNDCKYRTHFLDVHFPVEMMTKLELRLVPHRCFVDFSNGRIDTSAALSKYMGENLHRCVNRCVALKKFRIVVIGREGELFCEFVDLMVRHDLEHVQYNGDIDWMQQGGEVLWLSEKAQTVVRSWVTAGKKVKFIVRGSGEA